MERPGPEPAPSAAEVEERLREPLAALGLALGSREAELVAAYLALLLPWNARVNLTGARSAREILDRHLADSFALVPHLPAGARRLVDVGAGAGFLGVGVAIVRPDVHCVLLEPVGKKHAFLRAVARELPLRNVEALAERLEDHCGRPDFAAYDVAASRATWPPAAWFEKARRVVRPGGLAVAFEGREPAPLAPGVRRIPYRFGGRRASLLLLQL